MKDCNRNPKDILFDIPPFEYVRQREMHQFVSSPKIRRKKKKGGIHSFFEVISREVWCLDQSSEEWKVCMEYFLS